MAEINRREVIKEIRRLMLESKLDALIVPVTDPHLGEYVPEHWRIIEWLTGFTGSAANVVITHDFAGLWTDSRYFIAAEEQLKGSGFELVKLKIPHTPEYIEWITSALKAGGRVGVDGRVIPVATVNKMREAFSVKKIELDIEADLISPLWHNRPPMPETGIFEHELRFAGISREDKITQVRTVMEKMGADNHMLTSLDDIAWMLNVRGGDVTYSPLFTAFALITRSQVLLMINEDKVPAILKQKFDREGIVLLPYEETDSMISEISPDESLLVTSGTLSAVLFKAIPEGVRLIEDVSVPGRLKAIKNETEQLHIRDVMVRDGVALTRFFYWLENSIGKESITEISAADKLLSFRMDQENCTGPSFATIAGYNEHAALPHYCAVPETDAELRPEGIFLCDSGGQYLDGTTDVTRTIALGKPTKQQKTDFTLALKGTINLAMAKFPLGTKGYQIEILARKALWDNGMNYGHGTGHGVGYFLNVHEGPQTIGTGASGDLKTNIEPGMLTADEPAIYREGEYGFRTENLILCVDDRETEYGRFLRFDTVTLCYIDSTLIEKELMTEAETAWINDYHSKVFEKLSPALNPEEKSWLKSKTCLI
ncbi:MAG: aminopeptidase P family protein [Bacteroidales bacterium]|nr:aminopeptidase P family protein [Bacteroidales bacterium]